MYHREEAAFDMCKDDLEKSCNVDITLNQHLDIKDTISGIDNICDDRTGNIIAHIYLCRTDREAARLI